MKQCKTCSELFEPKQKFNSTIKTNRCDVCLKTAQALKNLANIKREKKIKQKEDLLTLQDYVGMTQKVFNKWIRLRDEGLNCISCGKVIKEGNCDAGHLWSAGGHANLRFNEMNVNSQCSRPCNKDKSGDPNNYRIGFIKKYGKEQLEYLDSIAHIERKFTKDELKSLLLIYKQKLKQ